MSSFFVKASEIFTQEKIIHNTYLKVSDRKIAGINELPDNDDEVINLEEYKVIPGFIDLHIHGSAGHDVMDASNTALEAISQAIAASGVTGFLATTVTSSWEATLAAFENISICYKKGLIGAELLGGYSEGLFFSDMFKGAHAAEFFLPPAREYIDAIIEASAGSLKVLAIAPEINGAIDAITYLTKKGIKVVVGHTGATYEQTMAAFEAGALGGVHIFNQMRGLHHREPGAVGAVLHRRDIFSELIADGVHINPVVMDLIYRLKGADKVALITDCICAGGLDDGEYTLGLLTVTVKEGVARTHTGALAGSTLTLNKAVANMINLVGVPPTDAINMASLTPAKFLGIDHEVGSLCLGKRANFAVLDQYYNVVMTFVDGQMIYQRKN